MILLSRQDQRRRPMELFAKLFGSLLVFVYHCFDRIVIHGYLSGRAPSKSPKCKK